MVRIFGSSTDALYNEFAVKTFRIFLGLVTFTCAIKMVSFLRTLDEEGTTDAEHLAIKSSHPGVIITINREHGSSGKHIGQLVAEKLKVACYYKEMIALAA